MDQELQASDDLEIHEAPASVTPPASPEDIPASLEPITAELESVSLEGVDAEVIAIRSRLREAQLLPDINTIKARTTQVQAWMASLLANGTWGDIAYGDKSTGPNWLTTEHLKRVLAMAQLYSTPNHNMYQHASLREKIIGALNLWLASDFQNPNWWHNQIGVPQLMGRILILVGTELAPDRLQKGITILQRASLQNKTGANLSWAAGIQLTRGLLSASPPTIAEAIQTLAAELKIAAPGQEGIQPDWSFHQHDALLYSGGYGQAFTVDVTRVVVDTYGTRFAVSADRIAILSSYIIDGQQWMMRGKTFDYGAIGRQIARPDQNAQAVIDSAKRLAKLALPRQKEFGALVDRAKGKLPTLAGNRHFWKSDLMVHQRQNYYISVRMFSARTFNTDGFLTGEGRHTRHLADGMTLILRTGDEYQDIFPVWDWRLVPGVTCEQVSEPLDVNGLHTRGPTSFVGGVSDGAYGLAAMDLRRDSLAVKKAWFCFEEEIVCLGAGLTCQSNNQVYTSVNQCLHRGPVLAKGPSSWSTIRGAGEQGLSTRSWVHHDGVGYSFPDGLNVRISQGPQVGSWTTIASEPLGQVTKDRFAVWINHGVRPVNSNFSYTIFPNIDPETLAAKTNRSPAIILSNTTALQAVWQPGNRICAAAFYQPGKIEGAAGWNVSVYQPCLLLLRERAAGLQVAVVNPLNEPLSVTFDIDRALTGEGCKPLGSGKTRISYKLPEGGAAGRSLVRLLKPR